MIRRMRTLLTGILVAGALGACTLMSKNPAGTPESAIAEPQLAGSWLNASEEGEISILHIFPAKGSDGKRLNLLFVGGDAEDGGWYALDGQVHEIAAGRRYLSLSIAASTPDAISELDAAFPDRADYPYSFMPYRIVDADHFELGAPPMEEALAAVKAGTLAGTVVESDFPLAKVSDSPEKIAAFLATQDEAKAFAQPMKFTRIKAAAP